MSSIQRKVSQKLSGYFAQRVHDAHSRAIPNTNSPLSQHPVPLLSSSPRPERMRTFSRTSRANGSAYGYSGSYRNRLASNATTTLGARRGSMSSSVRRRRGSNYDGNREVSISEGGGDLNFAQRLLMANENAVTNIADLWVAAAMNVDNEDPFESDTEMGSDIDSLDLGESMREDGDEDDIPASINSTPTGRGRLASITSSNANHSPTPRRPLSHRTSNTSVSFRPRLGSPRRPSTIQQSTPVRQTSASFSQPIDGTPTSRRFSSNVPSIFAHPGVKTPPAVVDAQQLLMRSEMEPPTGDALATILESRRASEVDRLSEIELIPEKPPSLSSQIPVLIIVQYGLLALHTTTHDQVFMSYLVS